MQRKMWHIVSGNLLTGGLFEGEEIKETRWDSFGVCQFHSNEALTAECVVWVRVCMGYEVRLVRSLRQIRSTVTVACVENVRFTVERQTKYHRGEDASRDQYIRNQKSWAVYRRRGRALRKNTQSCKLFDEERPINCMRTMPTLQILFLKRLDEENTDELQENDVLCYDCC